MFVSTLAALPPWAMYVIIGVVFVVMIVLTREFVVMSLRLIATSQNVIVPANIWGKAKTVSQMVSIVVILIMCEAVYGLKILEFLNVSLISNILLWVTAALTVVSGLIYVVQVSKKIEFTK